MTLQKDQMAGNEEEGSNEELRQWWIPYGVK